MATRIAVMDGGVIQQFGTPDEIYERPANLFVARFIGSPPMNILETTIDLAGNRVVATPQADRRRDGPVRLRLCTGSRRPA